MSVDGEGEVEDIEEEEEESDEESDDEDDEQNEDFLETLMERFQAKGYTLRDALSMLGGLYSSKNKKYNTDYFTKMSNEFDTLLEDMVNEDRENQDFGMEDKPENRAVENIVVNKPVMMEVD
jgi:hypothetical protein